MTSPTSDQQQRTIADLRRQVRDLTRKNKAQRVELARMKRAAAGNSRNMPFPDDGARVA